jgi:hypothetical protein
LELFHGVAIGVIIEKAMQGDGHSSSMMPRRRPAINLHSTLMAARQAVVFNNYDVLQVGIKTYFSGNANLAFKDKERVKCK